MAPGSRIVSVDGVDLTGLDAREARMVFGKLTGTAFALRFRRVGHRLLDLSTSSTKNRLTLKAPRAPGASILALCSPPSRRSIGGGRATVSGCGTTSSIGGTRGPRSRSRKGHPRASARPPLPLVRPAAAAAADAAARLAGRLAGRRAVKARMRSLSSPAKVDDASAFFTFLRFSHTPSNGGCLQELRGTGQANGDPHAAATTS